MFVWGLTVCWCSAKHLHVGLLMTRAVSRSKAACELTAPEGKPAHTATPLCHGGASQARPEEGQPHQLGTANSPSHPISPMGPAGAAATRVTKSSSQIQECPSSVGIKSANPRPNQPSAAGLSWEGLDQTGYPRDAGDFWGLSLLTWVLPFK